MHYYPGDPSGYRGENRYPKGLDQPEEGSRSVERIYSTKDGEKKLIRENIYEYRYGTTKSGQKRKRGKYILVETIDHATDKE